MESECCAESVSSRSSLNAELSEWLDQNQKYYLHGKQTAVTSPDSQDESTKQERGFTSALYQANLALYGEINKQCCLCSRCPRESRARISQHLEPFVLLSEVLEHSKLDLCLGKAAEVRDGTVRMLYCVGRTLIKGTDLSRLVCINANARSNSQ